MKKLIFFICSLAIIITSLITPVSAQNYINSVQNEKVKLNCKVDLLVSLDDGSVIIEKNADTPVAPASLTKVMTALVVLKNEKNLDRKMVVSEEAITSLYGTGSSSSGIKAGEEISVYDLLVCLLIPSGNDAAMALAIEYGGTAAGFVEMMNSTALALGCKNTHFENPHGLDSPNHKTTAKDMVLMAKAALEYSAFETIVSEYIHKLPATNMNEERNVVNSNYVINPYRTTYYNKNVKGIKTGTTDAAGRCLISYASKDGYNYMAVAMGGGQLDSDADGIEENQAFMDTNHMYKWAFKNLKYEIVTQQGQFVCSVPLEYCADSESAKLVAKNEVLALVPQGNDSESVSFRPIDVPESLAAPLKKGDAVGKAEILFAGQVIATVDLVIAEDASYDLFLYVKSVITNSKTFITLIVIVIVLCVGAYVTLFILSNNKRKKQREIKMVKYNELRRNTQKKNK